MKKFVLLFSIWILLLVQCVDTKNKNDIYNKVDEYKIDTVVDESRSNKVKLYVPKEKLEILFGKEFKPVVNKFINLDSDADEEYMIAFKKNKSETIDIFIFDIIQNDIIKKKFSIETAISSEDNFLMQQQNLFYQNDIAFIIEGKSSDGKYLLYLISYENEQYNILNIFTGDFSVFIDYEEIENDKGKYDIVKDITVINNSFSSTNTNIKRKDVYRWNYDIKEFYLAESEDILSESGSIDASIYNSEEKYYKYIQGFWYPAGYKDLIENEKLKTNNFDYKTVQFINFSIDPKEISIKYGDYIETYSILKVSKLWMQKSGLRFRVIENGDTNNTHAKYMDVFLLSPTSLKTVGPHKFATDLYVRLQKPFLEYVYDNNAQQSSIQEKKIASLLFGTFKDPVSNVSITFSDDKSFTVFCGDKRETGNYKINHNNNMTLLSFVFNNKYNFFGGCNFLININEKSDSFSLLPIKISLNGFIVDNVKSVDFYKTK